MRARHKKRGRLASRLATSATCVVIFVSRAFLSTTTEERETAARSLEKHELLHFLYYCYISLLKPSRLNLRQKLCTLAIMLHLTL